jgi:hypothetical protein
MAKLNIKKLSKEVAAVATVGFGRPLRKNADTDQLLIVAKWLAEGKYVSKYHLYEDAIRPSVERLGDGAIGQLARIEFRLAPEAQSLHYFKERRAEATRQLGARGEALKRLEEEMCLAIARDLALRLDAALPPPLPTPMVPSFTTLEELDKHLETHPDEPY